MSNLTILTDEFSEGVSGQFIDFALVDPTSNAAVNTASITVATATLRSLDTGNTVFANTSVIGGRGSYPSAGVLRVTFTAADMVSVGSRELQSREMVVNLTHSGSSSLKHVVQFPLRQTGEV